MLRPLSCVRFEYQLDVGITCSTGLWWDHVQVGGSALLCACRTLTCLAFANFWAAMNYDIGILLCVFLTVGSRHVLNSWLDMLHIWILFFLHYCCIVLLSWLLKECTWWVASSLGGGFPEQYSPMVAEFTQPWSDCSHLGPVFNCAIIVKLPAHCF